MFDKIFMVKLQAIYDNILNTTSKFNDGTFTLFEIVVCRSLCFICIFSFILLRHLMHIVGYFSLCTSVIYQNNL